MVESDRWIQDYRSVGLVEWPNGLRDTLALRLRHSTRKLLIWMLISSGCILLGVGIVLLGYLDILRDIAPPILFAVSVLAFPIAILRGNDFHKVRIKAKQASRCTHPERFEIARHVDEELAAMKALGLQVENEAIPRALFVDPATSLVLQIDDEVPASFERANIRVIQSDIEQSPTQECTESALSEHERAELRSWIDRTRRPWKWRYLFYVGISAGFFAWVYRLIVGLPTDRSDWGFFGLVTSLWLPMTYWVFVPHRNLRKRLASMRQDAREGILEIIEGHQAVAHLVASGEIADTPPVQPCLVKRLSVSKVWWTVDGVPAAWRRE
ncbi:MAG: hypothetical protein AAGB48_04045 [Planctomycetota bacterium]